MITLDTIHVLVVEDERSAFQLVKDMLSTVSNQQYELDWASTYVEGIDKLKTAQHDVYIFDYDLGHKTSLDMLREVYPDHVPIPIVMLTGRGSFEIDVTAMQLGISEFLEKMQVSPAILERAIRYAIQRKQTETELQQLYRQVSHLERIKSDMIAITAHDLGSPLSGIIGYANLLEADKDKLSESQVGYIQQIKDTAYKVRQMTNDLLSVEKVEQASDTAMRAIDLGRMVSDLVEEYRPKAEKKSQRLKELLVRQPTPILSYPAQLNHAIANLIGNAIKYTPDNGTITVRVTKEDTHARFEAEDTGYGIPELQQKRIFQPFFRATSKATQHIDGNGLGLHLVRNIIIRHNGDIYFISSEGEGSTFGFTIPLYERPDS